MKFILRERVVPGWENCPRQNIRLVRLLLRMKAWKTTMIYADVEGDGVMSKSQIRPVADGGKVAGDQNGIQLISADESLLGDRLGQIKIVGGLLATHSCGFRISGGFW